ncbi:MAG: TIGR00730 family Rossman fold protein [Bacteroidales bacterium]
MKTSEEKKIRAIGVFCGSSAGGSAIYAEAASALGRLLVKNEITMVYGGGNIGLMGVIADAMLAEGGNVIGVIPGHLLDKELAHQGVSDMRVVEGMASRKNLIYELSDAFIAMPGGFGTMDEIFEMLTQFQLGISDKPCGLLNTKGFFDLLVKQLDLFVTERFLRQEHRDHLLISHDPEILLAKMTEAARHGLNDQEWIEALKINNKY